MGLPSLSVATRVACYSLIGTTVRGAMAVHIFAVLLIDYFCWSVTSFVTPGFSTFFFSLGTKELELVFGRLPRFGGNEWSPLSDTF